MVKVNFVHARAVVGKGLDGDRGILGLARQFLDASLGCCHGLAVAQDRHLHSLLLTGPFCFVVTGRKCLLLTFMWMLWRKCSLHDVSSRDVKVCRSSCASV